MSNITATQENGNVIIRSARAGQKHEDREIIPLKSLTVDKDRHSTVSIAHESEKNKIVLCETIHNSEDTILVYSDQSSLNVLRVGPTDESPLKRFITVRNRVISLRLSKRRLGITFVGYVLNPYNIPVSAQTYSVDERNTLQANVQILKRASSKIGLFRHLHNMSFSCSSLLEGGEPPINSPVRLTLTIDGQPAHYGFVKTNRSYSHGKQYYAPIRRTRKNGFSIHMRRTSGGGLVLVRRRLEQIENTLWFRIIESKPVSFLLYHSAHLVRSLSKRKFNIFFEKLTSKAEEGALEVFEKVKEVSPNSRNYFIIRDDAPDYQKLQETSNVVKNFTLKSYWLIYRATTIISTESQINVNIMRSSNYYIRSAAYSQTFVFLQHGIIFLKNLSLTSSFLKNRENEPDWIIVSSKKEREVVTRMLNIDQGRILNVGIPMFDTINYGTISDKSPDIATIMLTWKPYEEHLYDFSKSFYYKSVTALYSELAEQLPKENIRIVAHPKFVQLLRSTELGSSVATEPVSAVLQKTKLLVTDYSSVAYYSFYLGSAVIFYQEDLAEYESAVGKLVPGDDEYIGRRAFNVDEFRKLLEKSVSHHKIDLSKLRTAKDEKMYASINEFSDGKNIDRLVTELKKRNII